MDDRNDREVGAWIVPYVRQQAGLRVLVHAPLAGFTRERSVNGTVVWYSCGVSSAVAARLVLDNPSYPRPIRICNCASTLSTEHPDNKRFLADCQRWYGQEIELLYSEEYSDIYDVFAKTGWLVGPAGARCTTELKKRIRLEHSSPRETHVFGFDGAEQGRFDRFKKHNPEYPLVRAPLLEKRISKANALRILKGAGIELPAMYRMGYRNNNCLGCVKGQLGYWNKIRKDFPGVFQRMAKIEREMDVAICKTEGEGRERIPVFLDELPPDAGNYQQEPSVQCGVWCDSEPDEPMEQGELF